jgi:hypothetical protein
LYQQGSAMRLDDPLGTEPPPPAIFDRDLPARLYFFDESGERRRQRIGDTAFLFSVQSLKQITPDFIDVQHLAVQGEHHDPGALAAACRNPAVAIPR